MYFRVRNSLRGIIPSTQHHLFGFETEDMFLSAIHRIHEKWAGMSGECMEQRHDGKDLRIRFRNIYRHYEDAWIPDFMLVRIPDPPEPVRDRKAEALEKELDRIYGFD